MLLRLFLLSLSLLLQFLNIECDLRVPRKFSDQLLPAGQRAGQDIPHLGKILKLDTYLSPSSVESLPSKFSIFNRRNHSKEVTFTPSKYCIASTCYGPFQFDLDKLVQSGFDPKLKTVILVPGFLSEDHVAWEERAKDLWLEIEDVNVILVTWRSGNRYVYDYAVSNTPLVARQITILLHYLAELGGLQITDFGFLRKIHIIGHSLGSHIAAFVGQDLSGQMGRITALDPAGPYFDQMPRNMRLDNMDAVLVDVIHTNAGRLKYKNAVMSSILKGVEKSVSILPGVGHKLPDFMGSNFTFEADTAWFGIEEQVGDIDYYANNGRVQPGCEDLLHICDHNRANDLLENILTYQRDLLRLPTTKQHPKENRLLAFRSSDFELFLTGNNFNNSLCQAILRDDNAALIDKSIKSCTLPIDLITPVDELVQELKTQYDLNPELSDYSEDRKFFFKTHHQQPFLADHHLLRLHLSKDLSQWHELCALKVELEMEGGIKSHIELNKHMLVIENEDFHGIAMPFVAINGIKARNALNQILLSPSTGILPLEKDHRTLGFVHSAFPQWIRFQITAAKSTTISQTLKDLFNPWGKTKQAEGCTLGIEKVHVQPLINHSRDILGIYSRMDFSANDGQPINGWGIKKHNSEIEQVHTLSVREGGSYLSYGLEKLRIDP